METALFPWLWSSGRGERQGGRLGLRQVFSCYLGLETARGACVGADNTPGSGCKGLVTGGHPLAEEEPLHPAMLSSWSREGHRPLRGWKVAVIPHLWLCLPGCFFSRWGGGGVGVSWGIWKQTLISKRTPKCCFGVSKTVFIMFYRKMFLFT